MLILSTLLLLIEPALAEEIYVNSARATLTIESPNGEWWEYPTEVVYPTYDIFNFYEDEGVNYTVSVNSPYTATTIYLYHGDGTGQFISADTEYNHVTGLHANLKPAVVIIYSDSVVEELVSPELWEGGYISDTLPATISRPSGFTPPTTVYAQINSALSDNGHTLVPAPVAPVVDEVISTLPDGTQSVWVLFSDSTREKYWLYTNGVAEPQDGLDGKPFCYCTGESCVKHTAKPATGTKCRAYHEEGDYDPNGKKRFKCFEDDAECD